MTAYAGDDDLLRRLTEMLEALERLSLEQKIHTPQRDKQFDELVGGLAGVVKALGERERRRQDEARFDALLAAMERNTARFLDATGKSVANGQQRLAASEERLARLEEAMLLRAGPPFERREELEAEGEFIRRGLEGPPTAGESASLLKDAPRRRVPSGLQVLARAIAHADGSAQAQGTP